MMKENILLIDFEPSREWKFGEYLEQHIREKLVVKKCISNNRKGKINNVIRYLKYFFFSFSIFINRKKYDKIIAWQQFYGIILAFWCRLFKVKKKNDIYILTFIYKRKYGKLGSIYHKFITYSINNKYVNKLVCFSSSEPEYYSSLFNISKDKFVYVPLGEEIDDSSITNTKFEDRRGVVSLGLSNRDYPFLVSVFKNIDEDLDIYADKDITVTDRIHFHSETIGKRVNKLFASTKLLVIPLQDTNISAGQLTALHAMQMGLPVVATKSNGIEDFIEDGVNGFLVENKENEWIEKVNLLLEDSLLWESMSKKTVEMFYSNHTILSMAVNISKVITNEA